MDIQYERRPVNRWTFGYWYEVDTSERVSSDMICATLDERWRAQNTGKRYLSELDNRVTLVLPDNYPRPMRKRKLSGNERAWIDYLSTALVIVIAGLVLLYFLSRYAA